MREQLNVGATSETTRTFKTIHTKPTLIHSNKTNINDDYDGQMIFGELVGLTFPDICLTGDENPGKTSSRKSVLSRDRTGARCGTGVHATACFTAVTLLTDDKIAFRDTGTEFY